MDAWNEHKYISGVTGHHIPFPCGELNARPRRPLLDSLHLVDDDKYHKC